MSCLGATGSPCLDANGEPARTRWITQLGHPFVQITNITTRTYRVEWTPDAALKVRIMYRTAGSSTAMAVVLVDGSVGYWDAPDTTGDQICCVRFENLTVGAETGFVHFNVELTRVVNTFDSTDVHDATFDETFNTLDEDR